MSHSQEQLFDPRLQGPFTMLIAGPTSCGKSQLVFQLLRKVESLITPEVQHVTYCYSQWQSGYDEFKEKVEFKLGLPSEDTLLNSNSSGTAPHTLLILDDVTTKEDIRTITRIFTEGSHHQNMSVIFITQNLFMKDPNYRLISLNAHYLVVFKNPRDMSQINFLSRQVFPRKPKLLTTVYNNETQAKHSYILLDFKQATPDYLRIRNSITTPWNTAVFVPDKNR